MKIKQLPLGALQTNCYIIHDETDAIIIDPGADGNIVGNYLKEMHVHPIAILLTHAHFDHIGAVDELRKEFNLDVYLHEKEQSWLEDSLLNGSQLFGVTAPIKTSPAEKTLEEGLLTLGKFKMEVCYTPGHSPGSVSFLFKEEGFGVVGDTLFQGSIGRTDLPGGDHNQLLHSIKEKLLSCSDELTVYPGHGPQTTIGIERKINPFLQRI
ncbi:glyoxylase-like metal-dependent hydrolase (beta-lactamase superfamily II) [Salirhabdus euzebyi]|uniref:Glyoxylase-like metal-dependent hydrolase (Beta-lactamase superfamily II) n=1 Tax=Salirhabdus euzebyi TaxID=394506 RepID=A0A841Q7B2_9BACI|nr:MBL fold metallo-hydrolase [Salirhabdus euzebyi]MBB6454265.1 glyoxylase-like metal-dependent hydrolase (beta-lactamase superfamily II) [Salirhabdus euzebyi]